MNDLPVTRGRRDILFGIAAVAATLVSAPGCNSPPTARPPTDKDNMTAPTRNTQVVRISKGSFNLANVAQAERALAESERALRDPLARLPGLLHYYVGIDRERGYLTNVSVWDSLEHAHQLDTLPAMLAQRPILEAAGVTFETITNHETLWSISP